jgi:hypothetical protein
MNDADKKAFSIYEMIRSSNADRPLGFESMEPRRPWVQALHSIDFDRSHLRDRQRLWLRSSH